MYNLSDVCGKAEKVFNCVNLLSDEAKFYQACKDMLAAWPTSAAVNMTNLQQNRRAWLGAAASMFVYNCNETLTRIAWNLLDKDVQDRANAVATKVINEYVKKDSHAKTLFE